MKESIDNIDAIKMPQFVEDLKESNRVCGTLSYNEDWDYWIIEADSHTIQAIRRVFEGVKHCYTDTAHIPNNKRFVAELNWLMIRFPLKIMHQKEWDEAIRRSREHILQKEFANLAPMTYDKPKNFIGELYEFQKEGLAYLFNHKRCLLADEMGLGKTIEALALLSKANAFPSLIVCPAHLQIQWRNEIKRFLGDDIRIHQIKGLTPYTLSREDDIHLTHYLIIRAWYKELMRQNYSSIILDECQELRRVESQKYECTTRVIRHLQPDFVFGLSGTPIYNYGIEIYNVMDAIDSGCMGAKPFFINEWCEKFSDKIIEYPDTLGDYMNNEGLMLRRRKDDVLTELPEKYRAIQHVDIDSNLYFDQIDDTKSVFEQLMNIKYKEVTVPEDNKNIGSMLLEAVQSARRATGIAKAAHSSEFVKLLLDNEQPTILFAHHRDVMMLYSHHLAEYSPVFLTGKENVRQKAENLQAFMRGDTDLICVNLRTTAGLNLQRAKSVVFGELDWSPAVHTQAEDRAHRIGQKDNVMCYYLVSETRADIKISECLGLKEDQIVGIMKDQKPSKEERFFSQKTASNFMWDIVEGMVKDDKTLGGLYA